MGELSRQETNVIHVSGSGALGKFLRTKVCINRHPKFGMGIIRNLFVYTSNFINRQNEFDVTLCDEAHRCREITTLSAQKNSRVPQATEIIRASRVSVFFTDPLQVVRRRECGTEDHIEDCTRAEGVPGRAIRRVQLKTQFPCQGSAGYLDWLDALLCQGPAVEARVWRNEFPFGLIDGPESLEATVASMARSAGCTGRIVAGFCWNWSDPQPPDGALAADVCIGAWSRSWTRKPESMYDEKDLRGKIPPQRVDPYYAWATRPGPCLDEVGCIFSAQGFEFDHVGVVWGEDLVWRNGRWHVDVSKSHDKEIRRMAGQPEVAASLLRNTYRTLLSRGLKSCALLCLDPETKDQIRSLLT